MNWKSRGENTWASPFKTAALYITGSLLVAGCGVYSFTGASTAATTMEVAEFYNNSDLAPANLGQVFTNRLKDFYQQNSSLEIVNENAELHIEGTIANYQISPIAPVASGNASLADAAALTRLTITVQASYEDTLEPKNSFKNRSFSFYADFQNTQDISAIQEDLEKTIFDQILLDIFNATIANW